MVRQAPAAPARRRGGALLCAVLAMLGVTTLSVLAPSVSAQEPVPPETDVVIDESVELRGEEAVDVLESSNATEAVAAEVDLTADELVEELREDDAIFVTGSGDVGYADVGEPGPLSVHSLSVEALPAGVDVFQLESRPGVTKVLYLDFDGHVTAGTPWNSNYTGGAAIESTPFSRDGSPAFSAGEEEEIYEIWQRVAEDFDPFDINVTTRDPGTNGLRRTSSSDASFGMRMVVSPFRWYPSSSTIGIAFLSSFDANSDLPAFAFVSSALTPNASDVAETVSHEAGHTLGLRHDGGPSNPNYYLGHGRWAPIMGNPLGAGVSQWSKGEYGGATNTEDDIVKITNCAGVAPDDWPNAGTTGPSIPLGTPVEAAIGAYGDVDVHPFDSAGGPTVITVSSVAAGSNLRASVTLRNAAGQSIASADSTPPVNNWESWEVSFSRTLAAGRYAVEVVPIGFETPSTGFSTYGSMGRYLLQVDSVAPTVTPNDGRATAYASAQRLALQPAC